MLAIEEYKKLLRENKFEIIEFQQRNLIASYNNSEELQEFIKGWLNNYVPLPKNLYPQFLQRVKRAVVNDPTTQDGRKINVPYTALVIKARKL